jgi:hypothetical protein
MKTIILQLTLILFSSSLYAQWVPVNNGLPDYPPTDIINWVDTMVVSTYGGGIYKTADNGDSWTEMPATLPNLYVNDIRYNGGQYDPISVATEGGPSIFVNGAYIDCNGSGLTNSNVTFFMNGNITMTGDAMVGTAGDGVFAAEYTSPFIYNWSLSNAGLSGDALHVNDALSGDGLALLATNGGFFKAVSGETEWIAKNSGLSGDALKINMISYFGVMFIATDGGLYYSLDIAENWDVALPDEKFNIAFYINTELSPSGFMVFAFGENGFYTETMESWNQMDFGGMEGEVTAAASDGENLYLGFTIEEKNGKGNGGIYRRPLEQFIVGINENSNISSDNMLRQNHPNPFNTNTQINYSIPNPGHVSIKIYTLTGNEILSAVNTMKPAGNHIQSLSSNDLSPGIYFYSLFVNDELISTKKMLVK